MSTILSWLRLKWKLFLASTHLSNGAVCEMSADLGMAEDFHDWIDSEEGLPVHFVKLRCKRCGKLFII